MPSVVKRNTNNHTNIHMNSPTEFRQYLHSNASRPSAIVSLSSALSPNHRHPQSSKNSQSLVGMKDYLNKQMQTLQYIDHFQRKELHHQNIAQYNLKKSFNF
jgi:DNA-binding transcriptional MerR regulator